MKIAIMSDSHNQWELLEKAIEVANQAKCKHLLFSGDLVAQEGLDILSIFNGDVHLVIGNCEPEIEDLILKAENIPNINYSVTPNKGALPGHLYEAELDGCKFFMNHYPRFTKLAAQSGEYTVCIHGHDHKYAETEVSNTFLLNPGTVGGINANPTFMIFNTNNRSVEKITL